MLEGYSHVFSSLQAENCKSQKHKESKVNTHMAHKINHECKRSYINKLEVK